MKERSSLSRFERREPRLTSVQSSYSRWTAASHFPKAPDQTGRPHQPDPAPVVKDDIVA